MQSQLKGTAAEKSGIDLRTSLPMLRVERRQAAGELPLLLAVHLDLALELASEIAHGLHFAEISASRLIQ